MKFGCFFVVRKTDQTKWRTPVWECLCDACGSKVLVPGNTLTRKRKQKSCGCFKRSHLAGRKFGRLTAIEPTEKRIGSNIVWRCECSCSSKTITYVTSGNLNSGAVKSCGCVGREKAKARMLSRNNPNPRDNNMSEYDRAVKRKYPEYREWSKSVLRRDNFTCLKCGKRGGKLNAHHIEGYAANKDLRTELSNGSTLCKDCHRDLHHLYGHNVGRENLEKWLAGE